MGRKPSSEEEQAFLRYLRSGRDEMNLLEHSISSASKNVDRTTRSLEFSQEARDPETGEAVTRTWRVSFSAEYGRPVPKDDDVFVALMKVSQAQGLMSKSTDAKLVSPHVYFSSRHLLKILGWGDNGRNYRAIDDALNRLCGVRIEATNYFYDNAAKLWVDRKFGIIDDVYLYERAKYDRARRRAIEQCEPHPQSWLRWSDVMFESFQAGYVRRLDIEFYRSLTNPIARKLFRYLGKQFWEGYGRTKHSVDLVELCVEKLGYKQGTAVSELRRQVSPAIEELEERGAFGLRHHLEPAYGRCRVVFRKSRREATPQKAVRVSEMCEQLIAVGISRDAAEQFVAKHSAERLAEDIEHAEFLARNGHLKKSKAGTLYAMLSSDEPWSRPERFESTASRKDRERKAAVKEAARRAAERERQKEEAAIAAAKREAFNVFYSSLPTESDRDAFQSEALKRSPVHRTSYLRNVKAGNTELAAKYLRWAMEELFEQRHAAASTESSSH